MKSKITGRKIIETKAYIIINKKENCYAEILRCPPVQKKMCQRVRILNDHIHLICFFGLQLSSSIRLFLRRTLVQKNSIELIGSGACNNTHANGL
jgi:hypothetical protein